MYVGGDRRGSTSLNQCGLSIVCVMVTEMKVPAGNRDKRVLPPHLLGPHLYLLIETNIYETTVLDVNQPLVTDHLAFK